MRLRSVEGRKGRVLGERGPRSQVVAGNTVWKGSKRASGEDVQAMMKSKRSRADHGRLGLPDGIAGGFHAPSTFKVYGLGGRNLWDFRCATVRASISFFGFARKQPPKNRAIIKDLEAEKVKAEKVTATKSGQFGKHDSLRLAGAVGVQGRVR
jgi:hypothetical protein